MAGEKTSAAPTKAKGSRVRSPSYPGIDLEEAIKRAQEFYNFEKRSAASIEVAVKHWGFNPNSGGGYVLIAALKAFGLMSDTGSGKARKVQLTELALLILLDKRLDSSERTDAIKQAALMPKIHSSLWNKYQTNLPSDDNLSHELIFERRFNENYVGEFIREYRATIAFAKLADSDGVPDVNSDIVESQQQSEEVPSMPEIQGQKATQAPPPPVSIPAIPVGSKPVGASIPVTRECSMTVMATGPVTQKGIDQLMAYLKLVRDSFPES